MSDALALLEEAEVRIRALGEAPNIDVALSLTRAAREQTKYLMRNGDWHGVKDVADKLELMRLYARRQGADLITQNTIASERLRTLWSIGMWISEDVENQTGKYQISGDPKFGKMDAYNYLEVHPDTGTKWQKLYKQFPWDCDYAWIEGEVAPEFEDLLYDRMNEGDFEINLAAILRLMDWYQSSASDDWHTPQWLFDLLDDEFHFELDVCASDENHKCDRYFTRDDDGLAQDWDGVCWMNPPYGKSGGTDIYEWVSKAYQSALNGATVVCLVPARTDTNWWWDHCIFGEIRFLKGRIQFGNSNNSAPFPSAVVIFQPDILSGNNKVIWWPVSDKGAEE